VADIDPVRRGSDIRAGSRRTAARDSLFLSATIRRKGEPETGVIPVRVRNLSAIGMMADHNDFSLPGEEVIVTLRGIGSVAGKVAWVRNGRMGVEFDREVDPKLARKPVRSEPKRAVPRPIKPLF